MAINTITFTICLLFCLPLAYSQRPSYAGSRPPNGHKDKYRPTQSPSQAVELANRFGENSLEKGATQRPPQGVPVVIAEPVFQPISNNEVQPSLTNKNNPQKSTPSTFDISNRSGSVASTQGISTSTTIAPSRLPFDAHGDQHLIDHLSRLPIDQQPFWFINYQAIEAHRNGSGNNFGPIASRSSFLGK
ncbi:uncharacterized protein LOC129919972 [Episyrphus balteatus]|uniref:uncharacterized protein LOC129919972 n=1 Tax=Episyrphus balteatus TaxID=286459 RepID=UPI0024860B10|nr:uncharacterized protein LOC129919972 [Episyrphus balteatus]